MPAGVHLMMGIISFIIFIFMFYILAKPLVTCENKERFSYEINIFFVLIAILNFLSSIINISVYLLIV